jgi:hypothetical protein
MKGVGKHCSLVKRYLCHPIAAALSERKRFALSISRPAASLTP